MILRKNSVCKTALILTLFLSGCATSTQKRLALTASAAAVGAAIGSSTAPKDERTDLHAVYWAGILGVTAAIASNYIYSDEHDLDKARLENESLRKELDLIQNSQRVLVKSGKGSFKPGSQDNQFQSGKANWKLYEVDRWQKDGPQRIYHIDKMVEISPESGI